MTLSLTRILEVVFIIEIILILVLTAATYISKYFLNLREKHKEKIKAEVDEHFTNLIEKNQKFETANFKSNWKRIDILYPMTQQLDKRYGENPSWKNIKDDFLQLMLLPLARKAANSYHWLKRFFAAETFSMKSEPEDEKTIIKLAEDDVPLVYLHAVPAAINCRSEKAIQTIMNRMSKSSWLTQSIYLEPFEHASPEITNYVVKRLESTNEPEVKAACYNVLLHQPPQKITWNINKDLMSDVYQLRLTALKYITYVDKQAAVPILIDKLKDNNWEVKVVALHRLGVLQPNEAIPHISDCLKDDDWWVKMSAAEALKGMGDPGAEALKAHPDLVQIPFDATGRAPHTLW